MSAGLYGSSSVPNSALASLLPTSPAPPSSEGAEAGAGGAAWLQMAASQLAVQDYLSRVQAAAREPSQLAALQAGAASLIPGYEHLLAGNNVNGSGAGRGKKGESGGKKNKSGAAVNILDNLKLPSDTEIVKSVGSGVSTTKNKVVDSRSENSSVSIPNIPPGLTIERKKPGRKPLDPNYHIPSSGQVIDKVEITKIPLSNGASQAPLDMTKSRVEEDTAGDAPLNLSMKADTASNDACEPPALTIKRKSSAERDSGGGKIPSDYYACE